MAEAKRVDFNALPREVRERLIACMQHQQLPYPLLSSIGSQGAAIFGWVFLALIGGGTLLGAIAVEFGRTLQPAPMIVLYFVALAVVALAVLFCARRISLGSALPYKPGRFLFPMDFIDAEDRVLRVVPMSSLIDFRGVHNHTNGVYSGTTLTFSFEGGITETFTIHGKERAEEVLRQLGESQRKIREAAQARDIDTLLQMDPFFEVRIKETWGQTAPKDEDMQQPFAKALPGLLGKGKILAVSGAVGLVLALPVWHFRNIASDEAMFSSAKQANTEWEFEHYVREGKRHVDEVREDLLPRAALREAKAKGSVTALREFLKKYPNSVAEKEAREDVHTLFQKTLGDFREQASKDDPKLLPFMEKLLAYLEKNDTSRVEVRFEAPSTEMLTKVDDLLKSEIGKEFSGGGNIIAVAPHFGDTVSLARETEIVRSLQTGFSAVFPADVMALVQGPRIGPDGKPLAVQPTAAAKSISDRIKDVDYKNPADVQRVLDELKVSGSGDITKEPLSNVPTPTIETRYKVGWAGTIFEEEKGSRKFVGIVIEFHVAIKIPGETEGLEFDLKVRPPQEFTVNYTTTGGLYGLPGVDSGPSEGRVYDVMAERAFDQLSDKMRRVFFKLGSKAYGTIDPDDVEAPAEPDLGVGADEPAGKGKTKKPTFDGLK